MTKTLNTLSYSEETDGGNVHRNKLYRWIRHHHFDDDDKREETIENQKSVLIG